MLFVFAAAAVNLAPSLSAHRLGRCLDTLIVLGVLSIAALAGMLGWHLLKHAVPVAIACFVLFALAGSAEWAAAPHSHNQLDAVLALTAGGGFVSLILLTLVRSRIEDEAAVTPLSLSYADDAIPAASGRVTAALGIVALVTLSAFTSLLTLTYVAAVAANIRPRGGLAHGDILIGIIAAAATVSALTLWSIAHRVPIDYTHIGLLRSCCLAVVLALAIALLISCTARPFSALAAIVSTLVGLWNLNSIVNNVSVLQLRPITAYMTAMAACISLLGAATAYWALVGAVATSRGTRSFALSTALVVAAVLLHILLVSALPAISIDSGPRATEFTIRHNLFQDSLSISAIILVIEWPVEFLRASSGQWWLAISLSTGLVPLFSAGFLWAIKSNRDHVRRQARRQLGDDASRVLAIAKAESRFDRRLGILISAARGNLEGPRNERLIRTLSAHVRNQNLLAYMAVLAALVGALTIALEALKDSGWMNRLASLSRVTQTIPPIGG